MNLKKSIVGILAFAMVANPVGISVNQSVGVLDSNAVFATEEDSSISFDIQPINSSCIYGGTAGFEIYFEECENITSGTITLSYSEELTYKDFSISSGIASITKDDDNTLTISIYNEDGFTSGDAIQIYFIAPDEPEDSTSSGDEYDDENSIYCSIDIKHMDFPESNGYGYCNYGGISISNSAYFEEDNGIAYSIYKDHAEVYNMYACIDETVEIPATVEGVPVTTIGDYVSTPIELQSITVSSDNEYLASKDGVVYSKDFTELLLYPIGKTDTEYTVLDSCNTIKSTAFFLVNYSDDDEQATNLQYLNIPKSVTTMEEDAIVLYDSELTIKGYEGTEAQRYAQSNYISFYNLSTDTLEDVTASGTCGDNLTWNLDKDGVMTISGTGDMMQFVQWKNISETPWVELTNYIKEVVIEDGVTSVSNDAFAWCSNLERVTLANSVSLLDYQAFYACSSLTEITLPTGLREIGNLCFFGCSLESLELPNTLLSIGNEAFGNTFYPDSDFGVNTFDTLYIPASVREISSSAFANCRNLTNITIDKSSKYFEMYKGVLYNKYDGVIVFIPQDVTVLDIPEYITSLEYSSGYVYDGNVTTINVPSTVVAVDSWTFYGWDTLVDINVSEDNPYLSSENGVLYNKDKTELLTYPNAKKDSVLVIPETVTKIDSSAFSYSECKLTDIYYLGSEEDLDISSQVPSNVTIHYGASPTYSKGDIDGNGEVSSVDLVVLKRYLLNMVSLSSEQKDSADLNDDSRVNVVDLLELKRTLLNQ